MKLSGQDKQSIRNIVAATTDTDQRAEPEDPGEETQQRNAASVAIWAYRDALPPAISATVLAIINDTADVGPIARYRDEPASA